MTCMLRLSAIGCLFFSLTGTVQAQPGGDPIDPKVPPLVSGKYHPPVFQRGNVLSQPLPDHDPLVKRFIDFYSEKTEHPLPPSLTARQIVHFPSQLYDRVSWNLGQGIPRQPFVTYTQTVLDTFITSDNCSKCHDAVQTLRNRDPRMTVKATDATDPARPLYANWSEFGEWSVSLMALAARDPVFHAQVETERDRHAGVEPTLIDNICYSCHGAMGQKQIAKQGVEGRRMFNHYMIYSTPDNFHPTGYPYDKPEASTAFSSIGALARDGLSCALCHHIGPGKTESDVAWSEFYGETTEEFKIRESTGRWKNSGGFDYPFTSNFKYNLKQLIVPDSGVQHTEEPMHLLGMAKAEQVSYIKRSELCGTCHVVIVPKIPPGYAKGVKPVYTPPGSPPPDATYSGDPFTDPLLNLAFEQTTYFEYLNSRYPVPAENQGADGLTTIECQTCHMPGVEPPEIQVSSIGPAWYSPNVTFEKDGKKVKGTPPREYTRHRLLGINLFVSEMFQQFPGILGLSDPAHDLETPDHVAANLLNAEQSIVQHATNGPFGPTVTTEIVSGPTVADGALKTTVRVTNNAGHKFPTGAGFRRGFIEFQVLNEAGKVLWVSGRTNEFGVILGPDGQPLPSEFAKKPDQLQPHYETITSPAQVQIYEVSTMDSQGNLTSQTLSLFEDVKDNRLMPQGWDAAAKGRQRGVDLAAIARVTAAVGGAAKDPFYTDKNKTGSDQVVYAIPLKDIQGTPSSIKAIMHYQTIPPNFLVARFNDGWGLQDRPDGSKEGYGSATERLIYLTSRLRTNLGLHSATDEKFPAIENWTMNLSVARKKL